MTKPELMYQPNREKVMGKLALFCGIACLFLFGGGVASASPILQDWAFSINGIFVTASSGFNMSGAVASLNGTAAGQLGSSMTATATADPNFDTTSGTVSGIGSVQVDVSLQGSSSSVTVVLWEKYSFSDNNDGFYGDYASTVGTAKPYQSYFAVDYTALGDQADPLGYLASLQSGVNEVPSPDPYDPLGGTPCCDVLLGAGETFFIQDGQTIRYSFEALYSDATAPFVPDPYVGIYTVQRGPLDGQANQVSNLDPFQETIYLAATVPEASTSALLLAGMLLLTAVKFGRKFQHRRDRR
jgi:hypothetical protein